MYTSMERSASFWAGFADCTEEAIAFLLESENVSTNDPVIQGLREHLRQKQIELGLLEESNKNNNEIVVSSSSINETDISVSESMETDMSIDRSDEGYNSSINVTSSDISSDISFSTEEIFSTHQQLNTIPSPVITNNTNYFCEQTPHTAIIPTTPVQAHTITVDSFSPIMHTQIMSPISQYHQHVVPPQHCYSTSVSQAHQQQQVDYQDPFQDPVSLAMLAQNNPEIASVAQELFQLLSEECADSLLCDEDDIDDDNDENDHHDDDDLNEDDGQIDDVQNVNEEAVSENSNNGTHDINSYSDCINLPVSSVHTSESHQTISSMSPNVVNSGQCNDDKENCQPQSVQNRVSPKLDNITEDSSNVQNTVLRLSPQNH